ncbi:MAG: LysR family transcriptional regulator [Sporomusaceae bacterium]|nr:LysR family transcriptional regulator [Sporomusaceae bacterium]
MDLRQLEYFQMVAKLNSITRAAEQMHVSQSTITLAIQRLEADLDVLLFDRSQKQLFLTAEGEIFLEKVSDILTRLQDAVSELNSLKQLQKGTLKVGVPPMIGSFLFPEILMGFTKLYPRIQLIITENGSFAIRQALERGELDVGIVNVINPSPLLEAITVARHKFVVCLPLLHPLAKREQLSIGDLRDEKFILFKESAYNRKLIEEECRNNGFTPNVVLASDQIETIRRLVTKGIGICFFIEEIARHSANIASVPLANPLYIDFGVAWKKDKYLSKAAQAFIEFITKINLSKRSCIKRQPVNRVGR